MRLVLAATTAAAAFATPASAQFWSYDPAVDEAISTAPSDQNQPLVVQIPQGGYWVSWFDGGNGWDVRLQHFAPFGCPTFPDGGILVADRGFSSTESYGLDVAPNQDALLTYRDDSTGNVEVAAARVRYDGTIVWSVQLTSGAASVHSPKIAALDDGSCAVAWTDDDVVRLQRLDAAGTPLWAAPVTLTPSIGRYSIADVHCGIGTDILVSMVHQAGSQFFSPKHLVAQRFDGAGAALWGAAPVAVFDGGSLQLGNFPAFVPDGAGGAVFTWYSASPSLECYVQRLNAAGVEAFPHNGVAVSTTPNAVRVDPHARLDRWNDDIVVTWREQNATQTLSGISVQRIDSTGARVFGPAGLALAPLTASDSKFPRVVTTFDGVSSMVTWSDTPSFGNDQVFAAEFDVLGTPIGSPALAVSTPSPKTRFASPRVAGTSTLLVWSDGRADGGDIYGHWVEQSNGPGPGFTGTSGCPANPNSTGAAADAVALGSIRAADNAFWLLATDLPPNQFGIFVVGDQMHLPVPVLDGQLCVGGQLGRFDGPGQIKNSGAGGHFCVRIDLTEIPQPNGTVAAQAGDTWHFQGWFRDLNPAPTSNFTSSFSVTFF